MKTKLTILIIAMFFSLTTSFGQKPKDKEVNYTYKIYPSVKYSKDIKSYNIQTNYLHDFLQGSLDMSYDTITRFTTYSFSQMDMLKYIKVKGLNLTENEGLKIVINVKSIGNTDEIITSFDNKTKEIVSSENVLAVLSKMKEKLLFAEVKIFEGENLLGSKNFEWKRDYQNDYIDFYKDKAGIKKYENYSTNKIKFANKNANALYFVGYNIGFADNSIKKFINSKISTYETTMEVPIYTAKGKKMDYSIMNDTQKKALNAIKSGNKVELTECITTWLDLFKQADYTNKKAQYNSKVSSAILQNCLYACFISEDFEVFKTVYQQVDANKTNIKKSKLKNLNKVASWVRWLENNRKINAHRF